MTLLFLKRLNDTFEENAEKLIEKGMNKKEAYSKRKTAKKFPTSISLAEDVVADLKSIASKKGIPYQTLMRMLIVEGLEKLKKAA